MFLLDGSGKFRDIYDYGNLVLTRGLFELSRSPLKTEIARAAVPKAVQSLFIPVTEDWNEIRLN